jgi:hypothetical protein
VAADGSSRFAAQPGGTHRYLKIDDSMRPRTLEAMTLLASQPPARAAAAIDGNGAAHPPP